MPAPTLTTASINLGIAQQMLLDRPDLAANVRTVTTNGYDGFGGHPICFYVNGAAEEEEAWLEFLGPAAHAMRVKTKPGRWHSTVTTLDVSVSITSEVAQ